VVKVDKRSDIWAFGCVLYEMLTAIPAFTGETVSDIIVRTLEHDPDWGKLPANTSANVRTLLRRLLAKEPAERIHDIADVRIEIKDALSPSLRPEHSVVVPELRRRSKRWITALVAAVLLLMIGALGFRLISERTVANAIRIATFLPPGTNPNSVVISPDGSRLAFIAPNSDNRPTLWVRAVDSPTAQMLQGTTEAVQPFWSPDSQWLGYFADGKLIKTSVSGGSGVVLCEADSTGGLWGNRGTIVFSNESGAHKVSDLGGRPTKLEVVDEQGRPLRVCPSAFLADGEHFLFGGNLTTSSISEGLSVYVGSLASKQASHLYNGLVSYYAKPGYVLTIQQGQVIATALDNHFRLLGVPVPISRVEVDPMVLFPEWETASAAISVSDSGMLVIVGGRQNHLETFNAAGTASRPIAPPPAGECVNPSVSPDGKRVAVNHRDPQTGNIAIWILDIQTNTASKFTTISGIESDPIWSSDGKQLLYRSLHNGKYSFYRRSWSGGPEELLYQDAQEIIPQDSSSDGSVILFSRLTDNEELFTLNLATDRQPRPFGKVDAPQWGAKFSPDGKWISYTTSETGRGEACVQPFPSNGQKWRVSQQGGYHPIWTRDGKRIFFYDDNSNIMVANVSADGTGFHSTPPRKFFTPRLASLQDSRNHFDLLPDGGIIMCPYVADRGSLPVTIIVNWPALLKN